MNLNMKVEMMQFEFDSSVVREIQELNGGDEAATKDLEELMETLNRKQVTSETTRLGSDSRTMTFEQREHTVSKTRVTKRRKRKKKKNGRPGEEVEEWETVEYEDESLYNLQEGSKGSRFVNLMFGGYLIVENLVYD